MNRTPRALLKGATSILYEGGSLTTNGAEYESTEAKDAIKGFVKDHNPKMPAADQSTPKQADTATKSATTTTSAPKEKEQKPSVRKSKGRVSQSSWSFFEIYLVALNMFLSLGIICTIVGVIVANYASKNPESPLSLTLLLSNAVEDVSRYFAAIIRDIVEFFVTFDIATQTNNLTVQSSAIFKNISAFITDLIRNYPQYIEHFSIDLMFYMNNLSDYLAVLYDDTVSNISALF